MALPVIVVTVPVLERRMSVSLTLMESVPFRREERRISSDMVLQLMWAASLQLFISYHIQFMVVLFQKPEAESRRNESSLLKNIDPAYKNPGCIPSIALKVDK